jgi:hypothetical protein
MPHEPPVFAVHPLAAELIAKIEPATDGAKSALSEPDFHAAERRLHAERADRDLFVHLVVLHVRLLRSGLAVAAAQLLELAKIGLIETELSETLDRVAHLKEAQKTIRVPRRDTSQGLRPAPKSGIGLRTPSHRPKPK